MRPFIAVMLYKSNYVHANVDPNIILLTLIKISETKTFKFSSACATKNILEPKKFTKFNLFIKSHKCYIKNRFFSDKNLKFHNSLESYLF